jgi:hypothetical protein
MAWKLEGDKIAVEDGHPVWIYEDGQESPFNAESALKKIKDVTAESVARKEKIREYETKVEPFADIQDPADFVAQAKKALETVKNLDEKKLVDAEDVETLKNSVAATYKEKISGMETAFSKKEKEYQDAISSKDKSISNLLIKGEIGRSEFVQKKTNMPPSVAFDVFKHNFQVEESDGQARAVAVRKDGTKIMSLKDPGSYATIDEALETLVNEHPDKDRLLVGVGGGGGASSGSYKGGNVDLSKMTPTQRLDYARGIK